jgi:hypothetical protein
MWRIAAKCSSRVKNSLSPAKYEGGFQREANEVEGVEEGAGRSSIPETREKDEKIDGKKTDNERRRSHQAFVDSRSEAALAGTFVAAS